MRYRLTWRIDTKHTTSFFWCVVVWIHAVSLHNSVLRRSGTESGRNVVGPRINDL
ncbi:unannotated protein [freshwater metagenome]|uniref:Unannotated protein n=1 Tax=freshwater metagenome TaxID=449393 RepID=A0A6J7K947_9ZZZZ